MTDLAPILALVIAAVAIVIGWLPRRRQIARSSDRRHSAWDSRAACAEIDASAHRPPPLRLMDSRLPAHQDSSKAP
jgi:hypothetical protein